MQGAPKFIILLTKIEVLPIIFPPKKLSNGNKAFAMYILPAAHVFEMPNLKRWNFFWPCIILTKNGNSSNSILF